jgi:hypothetical protein
MVATDLDGFALKEHGHGARVRVVARQFADRSGLQVVKVGRHQFAILPGRSSTAR